MLQTLTSQTAYKISTLVGILIVLMTPYFSWSIINQIEDQAVDLFEQHIFTKLDLDSLQSQYQSVQQIVQQSSTENGESAANLVEYSDEQIKILAAEAIVLNRQIEKTTIQLSALDQAKLAIASKIKVTFFVSALLMAIGMVWAILGFLGWYFHVQIFSERRMEPRAAS